MKLSVPLLPFLIAALLLGTVIYFIGYSSGPARAHFGAPTLTRIGDFVGTETEVAIAPDGKQYATVVSGKLWLLNIGDGSRKQITETQEAESFPSWTPDSRTVTFSRGNDTWAVHIPEAQKELQQNLKPTPALLKANATSLEWSLSGRMAFVRDRELWLGNSNGMNEIRIVPADSDPDVTIHSPRFSPDSSQIAFIKSLRNLKGEVWLVNVQTGEKRALISDRPTENPLDTGWIMDGKQLVCLTDRSGAYALWTVNFAENTLLTLTVALNPLPLERIGMSVWKDRIVLPRHFVHSNLALSDGTAVVNSDDLEFEPAISPDGTHLAYTVLSNDKYNIWTCGIHGENPVPRTAGREPRWAANGYEIVFTHTNLEGNPDIWKLDLRNNESESLTDADEIDSQADWLPKGRTVVFSSNHKGAMAIWSVPANGGPRVQLNDSGFFPRYTSDGKSILYWSGLSFWMMDANGANPKSVRNGISELAPGVLTKMGPKYYRDPEVNNGKPIWPDFDVLPDGRFVIAPIDIRETALWAVDLTFTSK
jgi:Tol biopolymer transport system component